MNDPIRTLVITATTALSLVACADEGAKLDPKPAAHAAAEVQADEDKKDKGKEEKKKDTGKKDAKPFDSMAAKQGATPSFASTVPAEPDSVLDTKIEPAHPMPTRVSKPASVDGDTFAEDEGEPLDPGAVKLVRFVLTDEVEGHEPVGEAEVFSADTPKIYAFLHFDNQDGEPYQVKVHFEKADGPALPYGIELDVGKGPRWRTWAYTRVRREPGTYRAVVRTPGGEEIASRSFEIVAAE